MLEVYNMLSVLMILEVKLMIESVSMLVEINNLLLEFEVEDKEEN